MKQYSYNQSFNLMRENIEDTTYGLYPPPMKAQTALNILIDYLLGEDLYVVDPMGTEQVNVCAIEQILDKYSKQWRKDWKHYKKEQ